MYIVPITIFLFATCLIGYLIHKVATTDINKTDTQQENTHKNIPPEIVDLEYHQYTNKSLKNVYYSIVNNCNYNLNIIHSIDNAVCLEFEKNIWISIMFNSNLGLFQISNLNPNDLELEYELNNMNESLKWRNFMNRRINNVNINFHEQDHLLFPLDLILEFENEQVTISFTEEVISEPKEINYGVDWLLIQFSKKTYNNLRRKSSR